ncbi:MAG: amidohydrolase [Burkholderiales bacterium]|nr:amidohydrolase [Burkholderiales bacterium]
MATKWKRRAVLKAGATGAAFSLLGGSFAARAQAAEAPMLILKNGKFTTLDKARPEAGAIAIANGRFTAVGSVQDIMKLAGPKTEVIDLGGRRVIPGLMDSHTHPIRGGLNFNMELRWDGVPSLADAMKMLKAQARRTPPPQWVRVVGGFTEYQFAEKRMPTLKEINEAAPDTPVFILRLYDRAMLNRAALRAVGMTKDSKEPPGSVIERDKDGEPTGMLIAKPNALILYSTLAKGPRLSLDDQMNSSRHFMRELNRIGITSVTDAGGGFQNYPQDYEVIERLARADQLTMRVAYNLFPQKPKEELADFQSWAKIIKPGQGNDMYRHNGAGEMLVYSAADFEDFREPRPDLAANMGEDLERVVRQLAQVKWPFRMHATYDETISKALDVFEKVNKEVPLEGMHWFIDHAETISPKNIDRVKALGGGIAVQHRMVYQGEDFLKRYGKAMTAEAPPIKRILAAGVPLGAGTDATRVASYNPWVSLYWLVTGSTLGGTSIYPKQNRLDRLTALRLWTEANTWFSNEEGKKGAIKAGQLADLAVLSADYMTVPEQQIRDLTSVLTILGGKVVHGDGPYSRLAPPLPPVSPSWSPVNVYGGYYRRERKSAPAQKVAAAVTGHGCDVHGRELQRAWFADIPAAEQGAFWGALGCSCWMA